MDLGGILIVDKPRGPTSHDIVTRVRRRLRMKRVGHAGTLDPAAEGVLVVAVGRATKLIDGLQASTKEYVAHVVLGVTSASGDVEGPVERIEPTRRPTASEVAAILLSFTGRIEQVPPAYSAVKVGGQPLYRYARRDEHIAIPARSVTIHALDIVAYTYPDLFLRVECSAGTYIRSLARDIGARLGTGGYLHYLLRSRSGIFTLRDAWTLDEIEADLTPETWTSMALHPDRALAAAPALVLDPSGVEAWYHGRPVPDDARSRAQHNRASAYRASGEWLGVAVRDEARGVWQPRLVVHDEATGRDRVSGATAPGDDRADQIPHVLTIGNFDGVHRGHQYLLDQVVAASQSRGVRSAALTFDPLPPEILRPEAAPPRLTTLADRLALIVAQGIDDVVPITFSHEFAALQPRAFVEQFILPLEPVEVVIGGDFAFGHRRSGTPEVLRTLGAELGFDVRVIERIDGEAGEISSSRIRAALAEGDVETATDLLGRPYFLRADVVRGNQRGRLLGYPTANLDVVDRLLVPADGIYAAMSIVGPVHRLVPSMVYVGTRPTFDEVERVVEVNLLDFSDDLYDQEMAVVFAGRVRGDQRFADAGELIAQMGQDRVETERVLATLPTGWPGEPLRSILRVGEGARTGER